MEETGGQAASVFGAATLTRPLRPHQQRALAAFETDRQRGNAATYLVVPPGGGKTLIGLEVARRLGRPTVVLCPNTVIQAQWIAQWQTAFAPVTVTATASREVPTALTVLTYQAVSTLDQGGNGGGLGGEREGGGAGGPVGSIRSSAPRASAAFSSSSELQEAATSIARPMASVGEVVAAAVSLLPCGGGRIVAFMREEAGGE